MSGSESPAVVGPGLGGHDLPVQRGAVEQHAVLAAGHDPAVVEHHDLVGQCDRREAVGDHERGPSGHRLGERELDALLGGGVHRGGGVVEHQHPRVRNQRAGDRQALALAAGQGQAPLADLGLVALRQLGDEVVCLSSPGRLFDLLAARVAAGVGDVLRDAGGEQEGVVADHRHRLADAADRYLADVGAVEQHLTLGGVVQPRDQRHQARLA